MMYLNENSVTAWATRVTACLSVLLFGMATWLVIEYCDAPLLGLYAFRETQTALTSFWVCREGFHLAYVTPVGGFPWSLPFEFPLYQWIVSLFGCTFQLSLDAVGRLVSYAFWIACLWPARVICRRLFGDSAPLYFWIFVALFLSTPIYLHYGHAFLPESAALFFALGYLACSLAMSHGPARWRHVIACGVFLTLAILQKSTTALPLLSFSLPYLWSRRLQLLDQPLKAEAFWKFMIAYVVPFTIGFVWVKYTDQIKMGNALGTYLTSSALHGWGFGTWEARLSHAFWADVIWRRVIGVNLAGHLGVIFVLIGFLLAPRRRLVIATGVALFLIFFMIFQNLMSVHEYYPFSNTVYLVFALAVAIGGLVESRPRMALLWASAFAGMIAINLHTYFGGHLFSEEVQQFDDTHPVLATAKFVREHTSPVEPILIYGDDWNSELPYYGQRKAFAVPPWFKPYLAPLDTPEKYLAAGPSAILVCGEARKDKEVVDKVLSNYSAWSKTSLAMCDVFTRNPS